MVAFELNGYTSEPGSVAEPTFSLLGKIPTSIGQLTGLIAADLSGNSLTGACCHYFILMAAIG